MVSKFPTTTELSAMISPEVLQKQGFKSFIKPKKVWVTDYLTSTGEDAYEVWVIYPKSTKEEDLALAKIKEMKSWIIERLRGATDQERRPYVHFKLEQHLPDRAIYP